MPGKIRTYESASVRVSYDAARCIHAAECVRRLPKVFDPERRPWIDPDCATADAIVGMIPHCPTGALHYERLDGDGPERPDAENTIAVSASGPLYLRGRVQVNIPAGDAMLQDQRVALCRCGASARKPLCDGKHHTIGFDDPGEVRETVTSSDEPADGVLAISPQPNGPVIARGAFHLVDASGRRCSRYEKAAFCRCGHSGNKPFCDGSHAAAGFRAD